MRGFTSLNYPGSIITVHFRTWRIFERTNLARTKQKYSIQDLQIRQHSTSSSYDNPIDQSHLSLPGFNHEPNVDLNSLRRTLEAHRLANQASLIRKRNEDGKWVSINVPSTLQKESSQPTKEEERIQFRHLKLTRTTEAYNNCRRDYVGKSRPLLKEWKVDGAIPHNLQYPWLMYINRSPISRGDRSAIDRLADEIRAFDDYVTPSQEEQAATALAMTDIKKAIMVANPALNVQLVGSRATHLEGPLSDIDFNVEEGLLGGEQTSVAEQSDLLKALFRELKRLSRKQFSEASSNIQLTYYVRKARVPIIKGVHVPTGLEFQLQSTQSSYASMESTKYFMTEFPTLQSLYKVIKQIFTIRGLSLGQHGGITSYPLLNMIIASLKFSQHMYHRLDVGRQLLFFLDMYSKIDFYSTAISVLPPHLLNDGSTQRKMSKSAGSEDDANELHLPALRVDDIELDRNTKQPQLWSKKNKHHPYLMRLQDPADPENNLGRSSYLIKHVQATIVMATHEIKMAMDEWDEGLSEHESDPRILPSLLGCSLGADYREFQATRNDLQRIGTQIAKVNK